MNRSGQCALRIMERARPLANWPNIPHQPLDRTSGYNEPFLRHLLPDHAHGVNSEVVGEHARDLRVWRQVTFYSRRQAQWISSLRNMLAVVGRDDRQDIADRLDPMMSTVIIDKRDHRLYGRKVYWVAPPAQNMPTPCAKSRWPDAARGSRVPAPLACRLRTWPPSTCA